MTFGEFPGDERNLESRWFKPGVVFDRKLKPCLSIPRRSRSTCGTAGTRAMRFISRSRVLPNPSSPSWATRIAIRG